MSTAPGPAHLLLLHKPLADNLVDRGFCDCRGDRFSITIPIAVIRNGGLIGTNVVVKLVPGSGQLPGFGTRLRVNIQLQPFQQLQCFVHVAVPEKPFDPLQFFLELLSLIYLLAQYTSLLLLSAEE